MRRVSCASVSVGNSRKHWPPVKPRMRPWVMQASVDCLCWLRKVSMTFCQAAASSALAWGCGAADRGAGATARAGVPAGRAVAGAAGALAADRCGAGAAVGCGAVACGTAARAALRRAICASSRAMRCASPVLSAALAAAAGEASAAALLPPRRPRQSASSVTSTVMRGCGDQRRVLTPSCRRASMAMMVSPGKRAACFFSTSSGSA